MTVAAQTFPVRVHNADEHIVLTAPLPGLEPENISVTISGTRVSIQGEERGPGQHGRDLIMDEWTIGPYYREISLPQAVDGTLTNATYGNGVLVLSMPKSTQSGTAANFRLQPIEATRGERVGHTGMDARPIPLAEHGKKHRLEKKSGQKVSRR